MIGQGRNLSHVADLIFIVNDRTGSGGAIRLSQPFSPLFLLSNWTTNNAIVNLTVAVLLSILSWHQQHPPLLLAVVKAQLTLSLLHKVTTAMLILQRPKNQMHHHVRNTGHG